MSRKKRYMAVKNKKYSQVGERIRELRGKLSQEEFAKKLGVSFRTYQRYDTGERIPHPHVLSRIAEKFNTTVDWILTGNLNIEKSITLELAKKSFHLKDLAEELEKINVCILKLKLAEAKQGATEEELKKISMISGDEEKLLDFVRKFAQENIGEAEQVKHFEQISSRSPLYTILLRIEKMFNKGEKNKIDVIKAVLTALESDKDDKREKVFEVVKALIDYSID